MQAGAAPAQGAPAAAPAGAPARAPAPVAGSQVIVRLVGGDTLRGELVSETADAVVIRHPALGSLSLARASVVGVEAVAAAAPAAAAPAGPAEVTTVVADVDVGQAASSAPAGVMEAKEDAAKAADAKDAAAAGTDAKQADAPIPSKWKFVLAANANYVDSADEQLDFRVAGSATYDDPDVEKFKLDAEYFFRTVNSAQTDNNLLVTGVYDYFFKDSAWLLFAKGQGQMDPLQEWEQRLSGWGGVGYRFFKAPPLALTGKVGGGASHEFGDINETKGEMYFELAGKWDITEFQSLEASCWIAPTVDDFSQYLLLARAEWSVKIDPSIGLSFLGGVRYQYQSQVPAGQNPDDTRVYAGLKLEF